MCTCPSTRPPHRPTTRSGRRSCWRRWRASRTRPSGGSAARRHGAAGRLYVCEMITTRALVEGNPKTLRHDRASTPTRRPAVVQLYGVDPAIVGRAVR